ncbi:hypothetical protein N0O92_01795, partial [Alkalihalobacillus sp. MEB130]|uniref:hypothetical protein n=1 Tax=Alkalihalobacillus sp. MEB130 TaxID=2976704 RepID=UPI0028DF889E
EHGDGFTRCTPFRRRSLLIGLIDRSGFAYHFAENKKGEDHPFLANMVMASLAARHLGEDHS